MLWCALEQRDDRASALHARPVEELRLAGGRARHRTELPVGARYALIGPNGAGKTTLINLITGMLAPNAGHIVLDDEDITALEPQDRVRRGLARTFQINTLFPAPERARSGHAGGCRAARHCRPVLAALSPCTARRSRKPTTFCAAAARRRLLSARRANCPMAASGCWKSRWRWRPSRRCCCSTSRRPACRSEESGDIFEVVAGLSRRSDVAVHRARHACGVPLRHAYHRAGRRRACSPKARRPRSPPIRACARSIWASAQTWPMTLAEPLLQSQQCDAPAMAPPWCCTTLAELPEHGSLAVLGRNGVGKSTLLLTIMGYTQLRRGSVLWRGRTSRAAAAPPRRHRHRLGGAGARDLSLADCG